MAGCGVTHASASIATTSRPSAEDHHQKRLTRDHADRPPVEVLHFPDNYGLMDPELIEILETSAPALLEAYTADPNRGDVAAPG